MLVLPLLLIVIGCNLTSAAPAPRRSLSLKRAELVDCPGYTASNIVKTDSSLTADLTLAGTACNTYGDDLTNLKLVVEYQTSKF
jgi:alpha-glucosidase